MDEKKELLSNTKNNGTKSKYACNLSGRPTNEKIIKFSPQPQSIISQLLNKIKHDKSNISEVVYNKKHKNELLEFSEAYDCEEMKCTKIKKRRLSNCFIEITPKKDSATFINYTKNVTEKITHTHSNKKELMKHVIKHDKEFSCDYPGCSYICKLSSNLIKHKRIHTSEKPYLCDQCSFRSNFVNSLKVHKRIHTSERPYACNYCDYRCNSSSNLKKHYRHKHWSILPD
ncbi:zinc finger protein 271-like isoform X2 [Galleria mellonella]|uniref:Zinc finger protein 271-like isoform X2 n=1 Tax=Galleria mellonella TaxID=7137 RepID=A0A6J1X4B2_GALME|nr:zinc finger protein 271-like isoform X2 [Galleria mellonella]